MDDALNLTQCSIQLVYGFWNNDKLEVQTVSNIDQIVGQITIITIFIISLFYENPQIEFNPSLFNINAFVWFLVEIHYQIFEKTYIFDGRSESWRPASILVQNLAQDIIGLVMIKDKNVYEQDFFNEFGLTQLVLVFFILITIIDTFQILKTINNCCKNIENPKSFYSKGGIKYYIFGNTVGYMITLGLYSYIGFIGYEDFTLEQTTSFWFQISTIITIYIIASTFYCCSFSNDSSNATWSKKLYSLILGFSSGLLSFYSGVFWMMMFFLLIVICCFRASVFDHFGSSPVIPVEFNQYISTNIVQHNVENNTPQQIALGIIQQQQITSIFEVTQSKNSEANLQQPKKQEKNSKKDNSQTTK